MAEYDYMELWASDNSVGGKFPVIRDGYRKIVRKKSTVDETMDGGLDVQMGGIHEIYMYIIRVRHTETESGYGDLSDLQALYELIDPTGTPSNVIKHTDHHGNEMLVYMIGDFDGSLLTTRIEGTGAYWDYQIVLRRIPS